MKVSINDIQHIKRWDIPLWFKHILNTLRYDGLIFGTNFIINCYTKNLSWKKQNLKNLLQMQFLDANAE